MYEGGDLMTASSAGKLILAGAFFVWQAIQSCAIFAAEGTWQSEWENTVKAAEQEGEVAYSASGSYRFLDEFHKAFPKIKTVVVSLSCSDVVSRIMTERRAGKYLADVVRCGMTSAHSL